MRSLGFVLVAIPFGFGVLRAVTTGSDRRYVWVALAAAVAAGATLAYNRRVARAGVAPFVTALVASTTAASVAGFALGARSIPSVLVVSLGFAICEAGGLTLAVRDRPRVG